jgi:hypothetical protein
MQATQMVKEEDLEDVVKILGSVDAHRYPKLNSKGVSLIWTTPLNIRFTGGGVSMFSREFPCTQPFTCNKSRIIISKESSVPV